MPETVTLSAEAEENAAAPEAASAEAEETDESAKDTPETENGAAGTGVPEDPEAETPETGEAPAEPDPEAAEVFSCLARRYNLAPDAYRDMLAFLALDATSVPAEVTALGLSPDAAKILQLLRAKRSLSGRRENAHRTAEAWRRDAERLHVDLKAEAADGTFTRLLKAGFSVEEAVRLVRADRAAARESAKRAPSSRPPEPGASPSASAAPAGAAAWSRAERAAIEKRALRGEKVHI